MTLMFIRIVVLVIVSYILFHVDSAPSVGRDTLNIFGNPFKDFIKSISHKEEKVNVTTLKPNNIEAGSMIIAPLNVESEACRNNKTEMDINGVCRMIWS
ncbi:unnamed protein product [Diatraea saccharalis]|uniref:Uncharacterized protein n=1 Tax=Diatraea saccharalis TaxID=40085 RepID=A0A9N9R7S3_9NEOP|nr:unnamed protein product [Diatraea saccharalis]